MTTKKLDAAAILRRLSEIRKSIPFLEQTNTPRPKSDGRFRAASMRTMEDFEYAALQEGLESLANDVHAALEKKRAEATETALQVYYAAEELAKEPENAHLIPHVEKMRAAYESQYGRPIPPKPKE